MAAPMVRAHVVMPEETMKQIDALVGRRARSKFLAEAAEEKLRRARQTRALAEVAGSLKTVDVPGWETPEAATAWVARSRGEDDRQLERLLGRGC